MASKKPWEADRTAERLGVTDFRFGSQKRILSLMTDEKKVGWELPKGWSAALDRADADVAAGRVYDGVAVRQRLRDSAKRMKADSDAKNAQGD